MVHLKQEDDLTTTRVGHHHWFRCVIYSLPVGLMPRQHLQVWGHCALLKAVCTGSLCHTGSWTFLQVSQTGAVSVTIINGWEETNTWGLLGCPQLEYSFVLSYPTMLPYGHKRNPPAVPGHFLHFQALQAVESSWSWEHSCPGWMGLSATWPGWRCSCLLQKS